MGIPKKLKKQQLDRADVEAVVNRALNAKVQIVDYCLNPFSKFITGLLASHHILTVKVKHSNVTDVVQTHTFFVKSSYSFDANGVKKKIYVSEEYSFPEEVHFFKETYPRVTETFVGQLAIPKCLLVKDGLLVFEDLKAAGYAMSDETFFDLEQLKAVSAALAKFHASSIVFENCLGKPLNKVFPDYFHEKHFSPTSKLWQMTAVTVRTTYQLAEYFGLDNFDVDRIEERLQQVVKPDKFKRNVICHGDLWKNNVMFNDKNQCILVDYQLLRYASLGIDLAQLLYLNCDPAYRETIENEVLEHYYSVFRKTLKLNNCDLTNLTYGDVLDAYNEHKFIGSFYALIYLQGILLEPEEFVKVHADITRLTTFLFENRIDNMLSAFNNCGMYASKMKKLVMEFIKHAKTI